MPTATVSGELVTAALAGSPVAGAARRLPLDVAPAVWLREGLIVELGVATVRALLGSHVPPG
jgi:hypothetical protein